MLNDTNNDFIKKISDFVTEHALFDKHLKYIVALSGGADSVALLSVMKVMGMDIEAATCNFHLRGEESDRDETFCVELCEKWNITLHRAHFDTLTYAKKHKISIEMAARDLRYRYFEELRNDIQASAICVAHHIDDAVETVLLNLLRGTGIRGLRGIVPQNGNIIRPLLCVTRKEIEKYLEYINQNFVTDSTNLVDDVVRNKIRLNLLPMLESINPAVRSNIYNTSLHVTSAYGLLETAEQEIERLVMEGNKIKLSELRKQSSPDYVLFCILSKLGFSSSMIKQICRSLDNCSGRIWSSSTHDLLLDRNTLVIREKQPVASKEMKIPETGIYVYKENMKFSFSLDNVDKSYVISKTNDCVCLDAKTIVFPLTIRIMKEGDRFMPLGMHGFKLLSDFMTDKKKSVFEKQTQLVVTDAQDRIIWVVNERPDNRFRITSETVSALRIALHE